MPRPSAPRLDRRSGRWIAQLGAPSSATGRRGRIILRNADGSPVAERDRPGAFAAFARLLAEREEEERRAIGPTACDIAAAYIRWHEAKGSKPDTIATHRWHLEKFLAFEHGSMRYNDRAAGSIVVADWTRYRKAMEGRGSQTGYVRLAYASVHACWDWAARPVEDREPVRLIPMNPFRDMDRPRAGRGRRLVLPWSTIREMVEFARQYVERPAVGSRNRKVAIHRERAANRLKALAFRVIAETGCRPREVATLRWDWVREPDRLIAIPAGFAKTDRDRFIALTRATADELATLRQSGLSHPVWVFVPATDERVNEPDAHRLAEWFAGVRAAARAGGITLPQGTSLYTFRHSLVTLARRAGIDLREMAPAMGHSAEVAERHYLHIDGDSIVSVMDKAWGKIAEEEGGTKERKEEGL